MIRESELVPGLYSETNETLGFQVERLDGLQNGMTVRLSGYLDSFNVTFFSSRVERIIETGYIFLSFDLGDVSYISSRGIGTFTSLLKTLRARGGDIHLYNARPKVLEVFRILGFLEYFNIDKSLEEAVETFRKVSLPPSTPVFPLRLKCPLCGRLVKVPGAGRGRCPGCKTELSIGRDGAVFRGER